MAPPIEPDLSVRCHQRYRLIGRIAMGGMAEIFLARMLTRQGTWEPIVLKKLHADLRNDDQFVRMFYDEARIASRLDHPHIIRIFELGEMDDQEFIAMELVRGTTLRNLVGRLAGARGRMPIDLIIHVLAAVLDALWHAHDAKDHTGRNLGIVHRDVCPDNILIGFDGSVKLADFGIAKARDRLQQTIPGLVKGRCSYMAPEQLVGQDFDGRADLFAVGEILYELTTGRHPFSAESDVATMHQVSKTPPPLPQSLDRDYSPDLARVVMRALEKNPSARYQSGRSMRKALLQLVDQNGETAEGELGSLVSSMFSDYLNLQRRAVDSGDDSLLVKACRVRKQSCATTFDRTEQHVVDLEAPTLVDLPRPDFELAAS